MNENDIIKITKIKGVKLKNNHNGYVQDIKRDILRVDFRDGTSRVLSTLCDVDITDMEYISVVYPKKIKEKVIFQDMRFVEE